jgi:O-antigen/teichoic acid export membrane protein
MRNTSIQGVTLLVGNAIQLASVLVVAAFLGPAEMARYALLLFLAGLTTQMLSLLVKPGTIRRTFGGGDDEDDDDDDDEVVSTSPPRTLGTGLMWALVLGAFGTLLIYLLRRPIADGLLGDPDAENLVVWSGVLSGVWLVFKIADITLWLERRPGAFLIADTARPVLGLAALAAFLAADAGVEGAILGTAIGTGAAALVALVLLRGSFEPSLDFAEIKQIILRGGHRAPIVMSFWLIQNADIFILSRFVDHTELGIYSLASRLGFVVSFLPQGFRMAMRPLRKSAIFDAFRDQYGKQTAQGQLLGYFTLICILAVLIMVMCGQVLVDAAPDAYADAAPLIPLTAVAFVMPALYRTVNQNVNIPRKRPWFIGGVIAAAAMFIAITALLAEPIGVYAAPVGMIVAFALPAVLLYVRGQRGANPLRFPYREVLTAFGLAAAMVGLYELLPEMEPWVELPIALALVALWMVLLVPLRAIPQQHWRPLLHMLRSFRRGTPANFRPRRGLRALEPAVREELRLAVVGRMPRERLAPEAGEEGLTLVRALRRVGRRGGIPVRKGTSHDAALAVVLFEDASTAVRNASVRRVLADGADANDVRALEDLVGHLAKVPPDAWEGRKAAETRRQRRGRRFKRALGRTA